MPGYVARRLLSAIPVLLLVTLISFGIMQVVPGDPAMIIAGLGATPQEVARVRTQLGLDRPPLVQLARWYRSEEHTSELQSRLHLVCRLLLEKKKTKLQQI